MKKIITSLKILFLIGFVFLGGLIGTLFFNEVNFLQIHNKDYDDLVNVIWQVQTTIVTLSVALLALVIGFSNEKKYGRNILDFLFTQSRRILTTYEEVIILILLTNVNYYFVAFNMIFGTFFVFFTSTVIIIRILYSTILIVGFRQEVYGSIRRQLLYECRKSIIKENEEMRRNNAK